jgi:hypothetical protein
MFGFGWEGTVSGIDRLDVEDKNAEAHYFLQRMEGSGSLDEFRWNTTAFLSSARSIIDWLVWTVYLKGTADEGRVPGQEKALAVLEKHVTIHTRRSTAGKQKLYVWPKHPLLVAMFEKRQETSHRSSLWIGRLEEPAQEGSENPNEQFAFVEPGETVFEGKPTTRVLPFCRSVLELIETIRKEVKRPR